MLIRTLSRTLIALALAFAIMAVFASAADADVNGPGYDLTMSVTDGGGTTAAGGSIVYEFTVQNIGINGARQIFVDVFVPAHTTADLAASTGGTWQCSPAAGGSGANCTAAIGDITTEPLTATFVVDVDPTLPPGVTSTQLIGETYAGGTPFPDVDPLNNDISYTSNLGPARDADGDGVLDDVDNCPALANADQSNFDGDFYGDACDPDDDNDGVADENDAFPFDQTESVDSDGDGVGNNADPDDDNDGQSDADESACGSDPLSAASLAPDLDGDGIPDCVDPDDDNDGVEDGSDVCAATVLPDQPTDGLKKNRFAANATGAFVGAGDSPSGYTVAHTGGCSAIQIIDRAGLGAGHTRFGISRSALEAWIAGLAE